MRGEDVQRLPWTLYRPAAPGPNGKRATVERHGPSRLDSPKELDLGSEPSI